MAEKIFRLISVLPNLLVK